MATHRRPSHLKFYLCIVGLLIAITVVAYFAIPSLPAAHQSLTIAISGSVVGTALAFMGAVWLWVQEQRKLAADDARREDQVLLREAYAGVGSLMALDYHDTQLDRAGIDLQKRLIKMKLDQNVALIHDGILRTECELINEIVLEPDLKHFIKGGGGGLYTARAWYLQLLSLDEDTSVTTARPHHYSDLKEGIDSWHEYHEEKWQAQMEWEEEERMKKEESTNEAEGK